MGTRRQAREFALQALFYMDMQDDASLQMLESFCDNFRPPKKARAFFLTLVNGVINARRDIDTLIEQHSKNWKIHRMSRVDRNVMRIAVFELLHCEDIPPKVTINEAVDVGKKFGTEESGAFINGIMDSILEALVNEGKLKKIATQVDSEVR